MRIFIAKVLFVVDVSKAHIILEVFGLEIANIGPFGRKMWFTYLSIVN